MDRRIIRQKRANRAPIFILLALILLLTGIIITIFSLFVVEDIQADPMEKVFLPPASSSQDSSSGTQQTPGAIVAAAVSSRAAAQNPSGSSGESAEPVQTQRVKVETLVPESPSADPGYFDDALFIGDSVTLGFRNSGYIPAKNIIAEKNINLNELVANKACYQGKTKTLYDMIAAQMPNPKKIYIMLGLNNLPGTENTDSMNYYKKFLTTMQEKFPDSMIFVETVSPMMADSDYTKSFSQAKIDDFNARLLELAKEMGVYYLNLQEVLKDANGYLISDYASPDGLHMVKAGHEVMYRYFCTHTVQPDGYTDQIVK